MLYRLRTDFRLSIITLLGASAVLGITGSVLYAWITGDTRRSGLVCALVACGGAVTVGAVVGEPGLFWLYPCLVTTFFLTNPRIAVVLNIASVVALVIHGGAFRSEVHLWTFVATALVVSACAYVFAYRNHNQRERLEHLATVDPLTGIKNRRSMDEELELAVRNAQRTGLPYALVLLDIDHFKKINDEHGHGVGDNVLVDLVALLSQNTRKSDQLFRFGGEEFVLLLPGVDGVGLKAVMNNLQQVLRKYMKHPGGTVTASFGVALLKPGESVDSWLARADAALYEAKDTGRDRIVFSDEPETSEPAVQTA